MSVVGIDEAGRGCWAGPLVAGAALFGSNFDAALSRNWKLADSKIMTRTERLASDHEIRAVAVGIGLGWVWPREIENLGLTKSVGLAMERALQRITADYDEIIIDGNYNFLAFDTRARTLIKADATVPAVSAASIIAKVARDTWMIEQAAQFPGYGFESHVGYGTRQHQQALQRYGVTPIHRHSYAPIRDLLH